VNKKQKNHLENHASCIEELGFQLCNCEEPNTWKKGGMSKTGKKTKEGRHIVDKRARFCKNKPLVAYLAGVTAKESWSSSVIPQCQLRNR
jgi:hypothetical protein